MDETALAFDFPHMQAAAVAGTAIADRIFVRDHVREIDIGAFQTERGVTQRVRFNVVLEVSRHAAARTDDVDKVLSYETITEAIGVALAAERLNLLETLAERVAAGCLADPRALRAFVRIDKLDRIPGALGVEIVRDRLPPGAARVHPIPPARTETARRPRVLYLSADCAAPAVVGPWLDAVAAARGPLVLCLGAAAPQAPARTEGALRVGLLAIEAHVWTLADRDPRLTVAATRAELDWALKSNRRPVWAPSKMLTDALPRPPHCASHPEALAAWLAHELGAEILILAGTATPPDVLATPLRITRRPADLLDWET